MEVRFSVVNNFWNAGHAVDNLATPRSIERRRLDEGFQQGGQRLIEIERGVTLPARIYIQFPTHSGKSRTDQAVIDLLSYAPTGGVELRPPFFKTLQSCFLLGDRGGRPIPRDGRTFD